MTINEINCEFSHNHEYQLHPWYSVVIEIFYVTFQDSTTRSVVPLKLRIAQLIYALSLSRKRNHLTPVSFIILMVYYITDQNNCSFLDPLQKWQIIDGSGGTTYSPQSSISQFMLFHDQSTFHFQNVKGQFELSC